MNLIECLAAIVITGGGLVVGLTMFTARQESYNDQKLEWTAIRVLQREMEQVRNITFASLDNRGVLPARESPDHMVERLITIVDPTTRNVTVRVSWTSSSGRARAATLVTVMTEAGS